MDNDIKVTIGTRIRNARVKLGITQKELDSALGYRNTVKHWEDFTTRPGFDDLVRVADILDVPTDYLLGRYDDIDANESTHSLTRLLGLSKKSLDLLKECAEHRTDQSSVFLDFLNGFINGVIPLAVADDIISAATARCHWDEDSKKAAIFMNDASGQILLSASAARDFFIGEAKKHVVECAEIAIIEAETHRVESVRATNKGKQPKRRGRPRKNAESSK